MTVCAHERRTRFDIMVDILRLAEKGSLKTRIMYEANLSFGQRNLYLSELVRMGFLRVEKRLDRSIFVTTVRGLEFCEAYGRVMDMLEGAK